MSIRVTAHTRRKSGGPSCRTCGGRIEAGERYRQLIAIREDWADRSYARMVAHEACAGEGWELTVDRTRRLAEKAATDRLLVDTFNRACPVGSRIRIWTGLRGDGPGREVEVRTPGAFINAAGSPVVKVPGDCIALTHVEVIDAR